MIAALVYKLTYGASFKDYQKAGWDAKWVQHGQGNFWIDAAGVPWAAKYIACNGDPITDLTSNIAAEQRARTTYEHLIAATDDVKAKETLRFLWQREVVHIQRFGEALEDVEEWMQKCRHVWSGTPSEATK